MIPNSQIFVNLSYKTTQFLYRGTILLYGACILFLYDNQFSLSIYLIAYTLYILLELIQYNKFPIIRTIYDYIIISVVLLFKDINNALLFTYFLLPIINSINYTGKRNRVYLLILLYTVFYFVLIFSSGTFSIKGTLLQIPVITTIWIISYCSKISWERDKINRDLLDILLTHQSSAAKPYEIYERIIERVNSRKIIKSISCFSTDGFKTFQLINSSRYIFRYELDINNKRQNLKRLKMGGILWNVRFITDKEDQSFNIVLPILDNILGLEGRHFIYIIALDTGFRFQDFFRIIGIEPFFISVSKYIIALQSIEKVKQNTRERIVGHYNFVQSAINTMHFIRNRLTPYQTLLDLHDEASKSNYNPAIAGLLKETADRARIELDALLKRSEYLLEKGNDPYNHQELTSISIKRIHGRIRKIWSMYFTDEIKTNTGSTYSESDNLSVISNINAFDILLTDIIGNIKKHYKAYAKCIITFSDNDICITFENDFTNQNNAQEYANHINSKDKDEIIKRKTHGVANIKQFASDLKINIQAIANDSKIVMKLHIIINKDDESINN